MKIKILNVNKIPNIEGFKFVGIGHIGEIYPDMEVLKNEFGQYYAIGFERLLGWINKDENELLT